MKFQIRVLISVIFGVIAMGGSGICMAEAPCMPPDDPSVLTEKIFNLLYQKKENTEQFKSDQLKCLLKGLAILETKDAFKGDKNGIIFVRAESYYRLGQPKKAYVAFLRVKLRLDSKDHPLYAIVEKRLVELSRKLKPMKIPKEPPDHRTKAKWMAALFVLFGLGLLVHDLKQLQKQYYGPSILNKDNVISREDMREQDGRSSKNAVEQYLNWCHEQSDEKSAWDQLSICEREKLKYARLIVKGHGMIEAVSLKAPYPIALVSKIKGLNRLPYYWQYTVIGILFAGAWIFVGGFDFCSEKTVAEYCLFATLVISCLSGIRIMSQKTINSLDELVSMLEPKGADKSINLLAQWIESLFRSNRQYYFFVVVMIMIVGCLYFQDKLILENSPLGLNLDIFFCTFLVWLSSSLIWFLTGSLFLMHRICNLTDLSMNPLSPYKTMGLEKMISVIGTFNIVCSMVFSFGCSIAVVRGIKEGQSPAQAAFWFFFITPMLLFYWVYPYIKIGNLVKNQKIGRMNFVKTKISLLFNEWKTSEDTLLQINEEKKYLGENMPTLTMEPEEEKKNIEAKINAMERYYEIFKKIEQSPESYFDLNSALELAKAMGFPSLFAALSALISLSF